MKLLTLEQLLQLHALVMQETGGSSGLRDLGRLESTIATQTQHVFGEELYGGHVEKATALIRNIIADHPFTDGNKRTAMLAGLTFLKINSIEVRLAKGELEDFAVAVATDKLDVKQSAIGYLSGSSLVIIWVQAISALCQPRGGSSFYYKFAEDWTPRITVASRITVRPG